MNLANYIEKFDFINIVGRNSKEKKNIFAEIFESDEYTSYYIGANSYLYKYSYFNPLIIFIIKYLDIDFDDSYMEIKKKITQKIGEKKYNRFGEKIVYFLSIFLKVPDGIENDKNISYHSNTLDSIFNEAISVIKKIFNTIPTKSILILDNYDYYDKWTKRFCDLYLFKEDTDFTFFIFSEMKIKRDIIEKYTILKREKTSLDKDSLSFSLKFTAFTGYFLHYRIIKFLFEKFGEITKKTLNLKEYFNQISNLEFIYDSGSSIYFLNRKIHDRIISLCSLKEKNQYYKVLSSLIDEYFPRGLYFKLIKYYFASITENNDIIEKNILENIEYFKKIQSEEHLLFFYNKLYEIRNGEIDNDSIIKILELYKSLDKYKKGYNFISKINLENLNQFLENTIKTYWVYFKRILGKNKNLIEELVEYKDIAIKNKYYDNYAFFMGEKIFLHYIRGEYTEAINELKNLKQYLTELTDKSKAECYYNLKAIFLKEENKIDEAVENYQTALKLAEKQNNIRLKLTILNNMGEMYLDTGQLNQSEKTFKNALELAIKNESVDNIAILKMNMANLYFIIDEDNKAYKYVKESLKLSRVLNKNRYILRNQYYIAYYYFKIGRFNDALLYAANIEKIVKEKGIQFILNYIYLLKSDIYYYKDNLEKAEKYFFMGFEDSKKEGNFQIYYYVPLIVKILISKNEKDRARKFINKYLEKSKQHNADAWFFIKIQQIRLAKENRIKKYRKLLEYADRDYKFGDIYYELWKLTGNHKDKVIRYYSGYECFKYKNRLSKID